MKKSILLTVAVLLSCVGLFAPRYLSTVKSGSQMVGTVKLNRVYEIDKSPLNIEKAFVEGKEVTFDENFLASREWVKTLEIEVSNATDKTLINVAVAVQAPDRSIALQEMFAGFSHFRGHIKKEEAQYDTLRLKPGEHIRLKFHPLDLKYFDDHYKSQMTGLESVTVFTRYVVDETREAGYTNGQNVTRIGDAWVPDTEDITDPKVQQLLDIEFLKTYVKGRQLGLKKRWDEESQQYVLDTQIFCAKMKNETNSLPCYKDNTPACPDNIPTCLATNYKLYDVCYPGSGTQCRRSHIVTYQCKQYVGGAWVNCASGCTQNGESTEGEPFCPFP